MAREARELCLEWQPNAGRVTVLFRQTALRRVLCIVCIALVVGSFEGIYYMRC